jgi:PiT family inorganic phosphate transporter
MSPLALLAVLLAATAVYLVVHGFQDAPNVVATLVASGAMSVRGALVLAAACTLAGPLLFGHAVAETIARDLVAPGLVTVPMAVAALLAAALWSLAAWRLAIPVSASHALLGGLVGAAASHAGWSAIQGHGLATIALALVLSPLLGFVAAAAILRLTLRALRDATPRANLTLQRAQVATGAAVALANGANDAQKAAGVIGLGLVPLGLAGPHAVPFWTLAACGAAIATGTLLGGERLLRTVGSGFFRLRPIHGFASQLATAAVTSAASLAGGPVSATQVMSLAVVGSGAADRPSQVRWAALGEIALAWVVTVPAAALLAAPLLLALDAAMAFAGR